MMQSQVLHPVAMCVGPQPPPPPPVERQPPHPAPSPLRPTSSLTFQGVLRLQVTQRLRLASARPLAHPATPTATPLAAAPSCATPTPPRHV
jgi:hypothetical protein